MRWAQAVDLTFYANAGVTAISASMRKLDEHDVEDGVARIQAAGLRVGSVLAGLTPFRLAEPASWPAGREQLLVALDVAQRLDAPVLLTTTGPAGALTWEAAADAYTEAVAPVAAAARLYGIRLAVEHTHALRADVGFVHTLRDALDLAARCDIDVCLEVNACWAERSLDDAIRTGIDRIAAVQVSDYAVGTHSTPDRLVPGDGDIPLARILGGLLSAGYAGDFDLELIGPRIEAEGYAKAVPRAVAALGTLLADLDG